MRPVSGRFLAALRYPHRAYTRVDSFYGGIPVGEDLPLVDGSISCDRGNNVRRTGKATFAGNLLPERFDDPLSPYGPQLHITRTLVYGPGEEETVELGWYRVDEATLADDESSVDVSFSDRCQILADAKLLTPHVVRSGTLVADAITGLVQPALPGSAVVDDSTHAGDTYAGRATYEDERLDAVADLATGIGAEVFADADGNIRIADVPDLNTIPPCWTVDTGESGVQISATRGRSREEVFNGVVIRADDTSGESGAWQYTIVDDDPASPTWWEGPFGKVPKFHSSPSIGGYNQAMAAAAGLLREALGVSRSIDLSMVPNFALEPSDVVAVETGGRVESHLIETLEIPLTPEGEMTTTTRANTYWIGSNNPIAGPATVIPFIAGRPT